VIFVKQNNKKIIAASNIFLLSVHNSHHNTNSKIARNTNSLLALALAVPMTSLLVLALAVPMTSLLALALAVPMTSLLALALAVPMTYNILLSNLLL
jgi:hypothetical protein